MNPFVRRGDLGFPAAHERGSGAVLHPAHILLQAGEDKHPALLSEQTAERMEAEKWGVVRPERRMGSEGTEAGDSGWWWGQELCLFGP